MRLNRVFLAASFLLASFMTAIGQDKSAADRTITIGEGKITLTAPPSWTKKQPASRIVEAELATPPAKADEAPGRLTAMGAGGSVEDNVNRWAGQFAGPGGEAPKPKLDKLTVGGVEVQVVDLTGTYKDSPGGPFAGGKTVMRDNYRMLGAIIQTKDAGNYFLKLYGPKATIDQAEKGFHEMVKSVKVK
jgi:gluconolactonase